MAEQLTVRGGSFGDDVILESYRYAPGRACEGPKHSHEQYQLCLSLDFPVEYRYRDERRPVPAGSLSIVHPREVHSSRDPFDRAGPATYRVMYVDLALLRGADGAVVIVESAVSDVPNGPERAHHGGTRNVVAGALADGAPPTSCS